MPNKAKSNQLDVTLPGTVGAQFEAELKALVEERASESFKCSYLCSELFSKYLDDSLVPASERRAAAITKLLAAEHRNQATNARLFVDEPGFSWVPYDVLVRRIQKKIAWILGPLEYPSVVSGATFTNGASTRVRRSETAAACKLTGEVHISSTAIKHWLAAFTGTAMSELPLMVQERSVLFTVPKKTDIDRCACKEPEGNALLQRSVGLALRARLRKVGINLTDQSRNQKLAGRGWKDRLATIDLSSASDTVSRQLVMNLLPFDWWSLMDDLRVHSTEVDGEVHYLEMFSSMGNGFTFELETLLFYAITKVVAEICGYGKSIVSVYGDDIICDTRIVPRLLRVLTWFGFMPNSKKTHHKGPFRESCGRHYWKGFDVTPFYVRKGVSTLPELINLLNHLLEWDGRGWGFFLDERTLRFWQKWANVVPRNLWGGISPSDPSALVTGHLPRRRLVPITKASKFPQSGAYKLWMLTAENTACRGDSQFRLGLTLDDIASGVSGLSGSAYAPCKVVGWKTLKVIHCGERSAWQPSVGYSS